MERVDVSLWFECVPLQSFHLFSNNYLVYSSYLFFVGRCCLDNPLGRSVLVLQQVGSLVEWYFCYVILVCHPFLKDCFFFLFRKSSKEFIFFVLQDIIRQKVPRKGALRQNKKRIGLVNRLNSDIVSAACFLRLKHSRQPFEAVWKLFCSMTSPFEAIQYLSCIRVLSPFAVMHALCYVTMGSDVGFQNPRKARLDQSKI